MTGPVHNLAAGAAVALLAACAGGEVDTGPYDPACVAGEAPALEIGKGELGFETLEDSPDTELIHGPQGGFHVNLALQATHLDPTSQWTVKMIGTIDGERMAVNRRFVSMRCNPSVPALQAWGIFLVFAAVPEDLHGKDAHVQITAEDAAGTSVSAEADISIYDPALQ